MESVQQRTLLPVTNLDRDEALRLFAGGDLVTAGDMCTRVKADGRFYLDECELLDPESWTRADGLPVVAIDGQEGTFFRPADVLTFMEEWLRLSPEEEAEMERERLKEEEARRREQAEGPLSFAEARKINPYLDQASYGLNVFLRAPKSESMLALERRMKRQQAQPLGTLRSLKWGIFGYIVGTARMLASHPGRKVQSYARQSLEEAAIHLRRVLEDHSPASIEALDGECRKLMRSPKKRATA